MSVVTVPKSIRPARIAENFDVFDFQVSTADLAAIDALDTAVRRGPEPDSITPDTYPRGVIQSDTTQGPRALDSLF